MPARGAVPIAPGTACLACGSLAPLLVNDHCHRHGWVRGAICSGWVDSQNGTPIEVTHHIEGNILSGYEWVPNTEPDHSKDYRPHDAPFW